MTDRPLDAAALAGLLADPDRRRVVAALVLGPGAADLEALNAASGLDTARAGRALSRLELAGLVERAQDGSLVLFDGAFAAAARAAGEERASRQTGAEPANEDEVVLARFVRDGRLLSIPSSHTKRLVVLTRLSQEFEPGRRYTERTVNTILRRWHPDTASLRRYLVDEGFLDREAGEYWRSGGPVPV
jgi:hypothetical protein